MQNKDKSEYIFRSKIINIIEHPNQKNYEKFSYFLDEKQKFIADEILNQHKATNFCYFSDDQDLQRDMLVCFPDYLSKDDIDWPIDIILVEYNDKYILSHKDFLGALMSLQIKRELIGDIHISNGKAEIYVHKNATEFILNNLNKIARVGVNVSVTDKKTIALEQKYKNISGTIASFRIDNIVSICTNLSRNKSVELINSQKVTVNYKEMTQTSFVVKPNDIIRIRGFGKFKLLDQINITKKNRYFVNILKYI